jgi:hypothetical protein
LALRAAAAVRAFWRPDLSQHEGGHLLEHEDEPREIRAMYEADLKNQKNGKNEDIGCHMMPVERG